MFLLDTNACIRLLNRSSSKLVSRIRSEDPAEIFLSSVTKAELIYGARHSSRVTENLKLLDRFFAPYISMPFDDSCAEVYAAIRAELASKGKPIGPYDLQIAAIARTHELILITHNTKEFSRVAGLRIDDWE
ncbi:type II toxin-antitoxin system VapC family toxin [bacterium]|nr:type II toxin-antitoxin system VapC family toxin [bacterium]